MRHFFEDLNRLEQLLLEMAGLVESSVHRSVQCLTEQNEIYANQVIRDEALINQLEIRIDDLATSLVALNQPVASDMRLIVAALKINTDLERMGDLAVSTVQRALPLIELERLQPVVPIAAMASRVEEMVEKSISAFVGRDADLAREVLAQDDQVDRMRNEIYEELTARMEADTSVVRRALGHLFVARNLERIADHATNIAEDVIFVARGIDVRHRRES
jgi:phosphate transport system protein